MGRKRVPGLEWLEPENTEQRQWARDYLEGKGFGDEFLYKDKIQPGEQPSHLEMLNAGVKIERDPIARELFRDMKDAWRQERNRKKKKDSGHQVCAFTFSTTTKSNLQEIAMAQGTSATELLETLISKAHKAHISKAKKQKTPQAKPEKTASNTFAGGRQPSVGNTETAQGPASLDENAQIELEATSAPQETTGTASNVVASPKQTPAADNHEPAMLDDVLASYPHEQTDDTQIHTPGPHQPHSGPRKKKAFVMTKTVPPTTYDEDLW
ncbi:hypothetical protein [Pseudomonas sp. EA_105y_Pfl2_R69]|uniref:hypothetical protein n=1 Tax=Pseudomonas sp. EA_105y_Pfl2_R69 TaxID=3088683 RepID=UPI0030DDB6ED